METAVSVFFSFCSFLVKTLAAVCTPSSLDFLAALALSSCVTSSFTTLVNLIARCCASFKPILSTAIFLRRFHELRFCLFLHILGCALRFLCVQHGLINLFHVRLRRSQFI